MFKYIKNKIDDFTEKLNNKIMIGKFRSSLDLDLKLSRICYYGVNEKELIPDKVGKTKIGKNWSYNDGYNARSSSLYEYGNYISVNTPIFSLHNNNYIGRQGKNDKYEFLDLYNKPNLIKLFIKIDKKNKLEVSVNEHTVKYVYDSTHHNSTWARAYEIQLKINDQKISMEELKARLPEIYKKLDDSSSNILEEIKNKILDRDIKIEEHEKSLIEKREGEVDGFLIRD